MVPTANRFRPAVPARSDVTHRTTLSGWVFRAVISTHMAAIVGQPVFAGVYLSGDYDSLRWHAVGADIVTTLGYLQVIVAIMIWVRLRQARPFLATLALVAAETVQYFAGLNGELWLHIPLGVMTVAALVVQFIAAWRRPIQRLKRVRTVRKPEQREVDNA
ncbi:hypothetical protein [Nonomuraea sp. NPDC002799]